MRQHTPLRADRRICKESCKQSFVVALQCDVGRWKWIVHQAIEHAARIGSPVDVVAKCNCYCRRAMFFNIAINRDDQPIKQIQPAMDVANDIQAGISVRTFSVAHYDNLTRCGPRTALKVLTP